MAEAGLTVIDADQVAREVVAPGTEGLEEIVQRFGPEVLQADGTLDRTALRQRITRDPNARRVLEAITHPRIIGRIIERLNHLEQQGEPAAVVEAALMVETGSYKGYDEVIVVTATRQAQVTRLMERDGMSRQDAEAFIDTQMPVEEKAQHGSVVIDNSGDLNTLKHNVSKVLEVMGIA